MHLPIWFDVFMQPVRDNPVAQVALAADHHVAVGGVRMTPLTFEQFVALGSLALAAVTIALTIRRDGATDEERHAARVAEQQVMTDKLDSIADMSKETRDTVREMSKQLSEHSRELARIETRIEEHDRRLDAIEDRCDLHRTAGAD